MHPFFEIPPSKGFSLIPFPLLFLMAQVAAQVLPEIRSGLSCCIPVHFFLFSFSLRFSAFEVDTYKSRDRGQP